MADLGRASLVVSLGLLVYALVGGSVAAVTNRRRLALSARNALFCAFGSTAIAATELLTPAKADGINAVDVYVAPVKLEDDRILPGNLREAIRMRGPTIELPYSYGA